MICTRVYYSSRVTAGLLNVIRRCVKEETELSLSRPTNVCYTQLTRITTVVSESAISWKYSLGTHPLLYQLFSVTTGGKIFQTNLIYYPVLSPTKGMEKNYRGPDIVLDCVHANHFPDNQIVTNALAWGQLLYLSSVDQVLFIAPYRIYLQTDGGEDR